MATSEPIVMEGPRGRATVIIENDERLEEGLTRTTRLLIQKSRGFTDEDLKSFEPYIRNHPYKSQTI